MKTRLRSTIGSLLVLLLCAAATACHKEECEKGKKLQENLSHLEFSLRGALAQPAYLKELCGWIKDSESPYLRLSGIELVSISEKAKSAGCTPGRDESSPALCRDEEEVREAAHELSGALVSDFGITRNIDSMCGSYFDKGYTSDIQYYIRDTINQIRNPVGQASARKLMAFGGCGD